MYCTPTRGCIESTSFNHPAQTAFSIPSASQYKYNKAHELGYF